MATTSSSAVEEWKTPADARRRGAVTKVRFARYSPPESPLSKPGEFVVRRVASVVCGSKLNFLRRVFECVRLSDDDDDDGGSARYTKDEGYLFFGRSLSLSPALCRLGRENVD